MQKDSPGVGSPRERLFLVKMRGRVKTAVCRQGRGQILPARQRSFAIRISPGPGLPQSRAVAWHLL
jgi:anthranilate/para-aminobenzoate synthase component II